MKVAGQRQEDLQPRRVVSLGPQELPILAKAVVHLLDTALVSYTWTLLHEVILKAVRRRSHPWGLTVLLHRVPSEP